MEYKKEVAKDYLGDAVGIFARQLIKSMEGTNGVPSQKGLDLFAKMMGFIKSEHAIEINTGGARTAEEIEADVAALDKELEELTRKDDA